MIDEMMTDETPAAYYKRNGPCHHECLKSCSISKQCLRQSARLYEPIIERAIRTRTVRTNAILLLMGYAITFVMGVVFGVWMMLP